MPSNFGTVSAGVSAGWTPANVAGLTAWFDPSNAGTITETSGYVTQLNDLSGNANHLVQSYPDGPITGTRTQNGLNVLDFVPRCALYKTGFVQAQPCTMFIVMQTDTLSNDGSGLRAAVGWSDTGTSCGLAQNGSGNIYLEAGSGGSASTIAASTPTQYTALINGASSHVDKDGAAGSTMNPGSNGWGSGAALILGEVDKNAVPSHYGYQVAWDGWIGELIIYDGALGSTDRSAVEAYLKSKWGTP